jgi:hypothetical protein
MFAASGLLLEEPRGRGLREAIMRKLLIGMVAGVVIGAGPAFAQTGASDRPNTQNPEATCPAGANCAPGQASSSPAAPALSRPASSEATGSPARPSSEQNPERTCPPGSRC